MPHPKLKQSRNMSGTHSQRYYRGFVDSTSQGDDWMRRLAKRGVRMQGDCWIVGDDDHAYIPVTVRGDLCYAHRAVYAEMHPDEDITSMHIHHMCMAPACINPRHLAALTPGAHARWHRLHGYIRTPGTYRPPERP
jgi:HNH endonuclease